MRPIKHLIAECRELEGNRCIINGYNYFKTTENIWMESEIRIESILFGCQSNQPAYLFLYERAMEQIEFQADGAVEFASPSTPGSKTKQYEISLHGQKELAQKLAHFDIINNQ
ncbi:MAG: hypothetical protein GY751_15815 [Bacteroidetes bacterium]|nr:hypothetical protein [Bacteroidota bacterium]